MRTRIHYKLMVTYLLVIGTVILVVDLYSGVRMGDEQVERIREDLTRQTRLGAAFATEQLALGRPADEVADRIGGMIGHRVTLIDGAGAVIGDSGVEAPALAGVESHAGRPEVRQAVASGFGTAARHSATLKTDMLYVAVSVSSPRVGVVRLAAPLTFVENLFAQTRRTLLVASLWGILVSVVLCSGASFFISRPIRKMTDVARTMAGGDFEARAFAPSSQELDSLARALNDMAFQLKSRIGQVTEEKSLLEAVLASATEGIVVTDPRGAVLSVNTALKDLFQVPASATVSGRPSIEVVRHPDVVEAIQQTLSSGEETGREIALPSPADRRLEMRVAPIRLRGEIIGAVGIFYDVTEIRRMERMRRDFVANVSHELRTPLTAIKGCAETLAEGALQDPGAAVRFVDTIRTQADRLSSLVDDLLSLSRLESGSQGIRRGAYPLAPIVQSALRVVEASALPKRISLQTEIAEGLPDLVCDDSLIEQVLVNLLDNAIKYTAEGGRVMVTARIAASPQSAIRNPQSAIGRWVEVAVEDTGIGIPAEHLSRIFERFYRVDRARSRALGGTGLGLSIVKHIAEVHGGAVRAESEVGRGSVFTIALPTA